MKKVLLTLFTVSLITVPAYRCMAGNGFVIPQDPQPMGWFAKTAAVGLLAALAVAGNKMVHWWNLTNAINNAKIKDASQGARGVIQWKEKCLDPADRVPADALSKIEENGIDYTQWESGKKTIHALWQEKDAQRETLASKKRLKDISEELSKKLQELERHLVELLPHTPFNLKEFDKAIYAMRNGKRIYELNEQELDHYYGMYEQAIAQAKQSPVVTPLGPIAYTKEYARLVGQYAWKQTKRFCSWVSHPSYNEEASRVYLEILKKKHRVDTLIAIVGTIKAE